MKMIRINIIICISLFCYSNSLDAQVTGFIKTGINIGTINQKWWTLEEDSIKYGKPLIRPTLGIGAQYLLSKNWILRQEVLYQIKGQGTIRPDVRSLFQTQNPDILRFMSFPLSIHRQILTDFWFGISIQPSIYLSGSDNYYAKEQWRGWVWGTTVNVHYTKDIFEFGMEYDHDLNLYYCHDCGIRFYTLRIYGSYHFLSQ